MMRYIRLIKNISNWWLHFVVKLGLIQDDPLKFRARNNISIEVPRRLLHEFKEIFMEECYTCKLGRNLPDQPAIIDIGANAGFFSVFAASRFPGATIFSYEPVANNFKQLQRNRELNKDARILCFSKAVYSTSGEVVLNLDPSDIFTTSASVFGESNFQGETIRVPCVTLPEIFDENSIERCDLLKMDCEGAEYEILYSCPQSYLLRVSQMAIEVHKGKKPKQDMRFLIDYLESNDFKTRRYSKHMLSAWR